MCTHEMLAAHYEEVTEWPGLCNQATVVVEGPLGISISTAQAKKCCFLKVPR